MEYQPPAPVETTANATIVRAPIPDGTTATPRALSTTIAEPAIVPTRTAATTNRRTTPTPKHVHAYTTLRKVKVPIYDYRPDGSGIVGHDYFLKRECSCGDRITAGMRRVLLIGNGARP